MRAFSYRSRALIFYAESSFLLFCDPRPRARSRVRAHAGSAPAAARPADAARSRFRGNARSSARRRNEPLGIRSREFGVRSSTASSASSSYTRNTSSDAQGRRRRYCPTHRLRRDAPTHAPRRRPPLGSPASCCSPCPPSSAPRPPRGRTLTRVRTPPTLTCVCLQPKYGEHPLYRSMRVATSVELLVRGHGRLQLQ